MVDFTPRPPTIHGCMQSWQEKAAPQMLRTNMADHTPKVRRRFTGIYRLADVTMVLRASLYEDFQTWFYVNCQGGVQPTNIVEPTGKEAVWRITEPPGIAWDINLFTATMRIERLPGWQDLV